MISGVGGDGECVWFKGSGSSESRGSRASGEKLTTKMERSFYSCVCISDVLGFTVLTYVWGKGRRGVRGESTVH